MISSIWAMNYQSLRDVKVGLGKFTVITGPTGTGKSAFIRAVKLVTFNARGKDYITRGEKVTEVHVTGHDVEESAWTVCISRGSKDAYTVIDGGLLAEDQVFTKLAGKVPDQVTDVLKLGDINFAGQFDRPFLLDSTGSEVARVLGKLTNVTLLYKAAQEANRRRLAAQGLLKTRQSDLDGMNAQKDQYATLPQEQSAVEAAEYGLVRMAELQRRHERIDLLLTSHELAATRLEILAGQFPPEPPSTGHLEELASKLARLGYLAAQVDEHKSTAAAALGDEQVAVRQEASAQSQLDQYVAQWGECPTCGQPVRKEHEHG